MRGTYFGAQGVFAGLNGVPFDGYEIHMGDTALLDEGKPLTEITTLDGQTKRDGASCGNVWGSYVHGIFERAESAQGLVNALFATKGLSSTAAAIDYRSYQEEQYDKLAAGLRESLDMERVYRILNGEE